MIHGPCLGRAVSRGLQSLSRRVRFIEDELSGLPELVGAGDVCIDVGAGFGLYTYVLADLVGARGRVHSLEPLPTPARLLRAGTAAAGLGQVHTHALAAGRSPGTALLSLPRRNGVPVHGRAFLARGAANRGPNREFPTRRILAVDVTTIDRLCATHVIDRVDFMKLDVEGAEPAVLEGATATLQRHRPHLLLEIEQRHLAKYGATPTALLQWLRRRSYVAHVLAGGRWEAVEHLTRRHRNYLFIASPP